MDKNDFVRKKVRKMLVKDKRISDTKMKFSIFLSVLRRYHETWKRKMTLPDLLEEEVQKKIRRQEN